MRVWAVHAYVIVYVYIDILKTKILFFVVHVPCLLWGVSGIVGPAT